MFIIFSTISFSNKISKTTSKTTLLSNSDDKLRNCDEVCLRIDYDTSIEEATNMVFDIGYKFILSDLKKLDYSFGLRWNVCTTKPDRVKKCNCDKPHGSKRN